MKKYLLLLAISLLILSMYVFIVPKVPYMWERTPIELSKTRHDGGNVYVSTLKNESFSSHEHPSTAHLLENGMPLGPGNASYDSIHSIGKGRFTFWHNSLYFSSSDNSNPLNNGRMYEIDAPTIVSTNMKIVVYGLTLLAWIGVLLSNLRQLYYMFNRCKDFAVRHSQAITISKHSQAITICWLSISVILLSTCLYIYISVLQGNSSFLNRSTLKGIEHENGNLYSAVLMDDSLSSHRRPSKALILEDGQPLGPNSIHDDIRSIGAGRYSFWHNYIYFSTSDNSSPLENGRRYEIIVPRNFSVIYYLTAISWAGFFVFFFLTSRQLYRGSMSYYRALFVVSCILVISAYLLPRLPILIEYKLSIITFDTPAYFDPVLEVYSGEWPNFSARTPGYPFFLLISFMLSGRLFTVVILQNILTLASTFFFLWAVYKTYRGIVLIAALALVPHVSLPILVAHDFALMSESLYASCMLFSTGFLLLFIHTRRPLHGFFFSLFGGYAIITRPAGIFLIVFIPVILLYLLMANKHSIKEILSIVVPIPTILVSLMLYNYITADYFGLSVMGKLMPYAITSTYWEPDKKFPAEVNDRIGQFREEIPDSDKEMLNASWDPDKLYRIFIGNSSKAYYRYENKLIVDHVRVSGRLRLDRLNTSPLADKIAWKAVISHPEMYIKWFWTMSYSFFSDSAAWDNGYHYNVKQFFQQFYAQPEGLEKFKFIFREYKEFPQNPALQIKGTGKDMDLVLRSTILDKINTDFTSLIRWIYSSSCWLVFYFVIYIVSLFMLIRSKFRDREAFLAFVLLSAHLFSGLLIALTGGNVDRYPAPTKFTEYLSLPLALILLNKLPVFRRQRKALSNFAKEDNFCWVSNIPEEKQLSDNSKHPYRSQLVVYEDDVPLGPAHALHTDIRETGKGCYSHWGEKLYFSTSDNSAPNANGRVYSYSTSAVPLAVILLNKIPVFRRRRKALSNFAKEDNFCWVSNIPEETQLSDNSEHPYRSRLVVYEDGVPLGPAHALHADIRETGKGCYSHRGEKLYFSTSDNSAPNTNGRVYSYSISEKLYHRALKRLEGRNISYRHHSAPINIAAKNSSPDALRHDTEYAVKVFDLYISYLPEGLHSLYGKSVLEVGPGINFGTAILLAGYSSRVMVTDRFLAPWDNEYHPVFYRTMYDWLKKNRPELNLLPLEAVIGANSYPLNVVTCNESPLESLDTITAKAVDIVFSNAVLEHIYDIPKSLKQLARITRPGGLGFHQIDFRDHRDYSRPLEYLSLSDDEFAATFTSMHGECGNRTRPDELEGMFKKVGFDILSFTGNMFAEESYLDEFLPRLRRVTSSKYQDTPRERLKVISGLFKVKKQV